VALDMNVRVEKLRIGPVQPVLDPEPAVAGVELEVVEVVELGGEGEGEVVAGVVIHHLEADHAEPEPHERQGAAHQQGAVTHRDLSSEDVLDGMSIDSCRGYGGGPLMVHFVDMFVDQPVVKKPVPIIEPDIVAEHGDEDVEEAGGEVRERPQVRPRGRARGPEAVARQSTRDADDNLIDKDMF